MTIPTAGQVILTGETFSTVTTVNDDGTFQIGRAVKKDKDALAYATDWTFNISALTDNELRDLAIRQLVIDVQARARKEMKSDKVTDMDELCSRTWTFPLPTEKVKMSDEEKMKKLAGSMTKEQLQAMLDEMD